MSVPASSRTAGDGQRLVYDGGVAAPPADFDVSAAVRAGEGIGLQCSGMIVRMNRNGPVLAEQFGLLQAEHRQESRIRRQKVPFRIQIRQPEVSDFDGPLKDFVLRCHTSNASANRGGLLTN